MYTESYLRYLLNDNHSLRQYYEEKRLVTLDDIKRNLMLAERRNNYFIPDHYYRLGQNKSFAGINHLSELFTCGLKSLANEYLEIRDAKIYVKAEMMNRWQIMMAYMPPLLLDCIMLWQNDPLLDGDEINYAHKYLLPNLAYTTYPSPYIPQLLDLLNNGGLSDLHMHLNGALETDLAWQDFLISPLDVKSELDRAFHKEKVKEQYTQMTMIPNPDQFYNLLNVASTLRGLLFNYIYVQESGEGIVNDMSSIDEFLCRISEGDDFGISYSSHPMELVLGKKMEPHIMEGILYIKVLQQLSLEPENRYLSLLFHYYLLILGQVNRMLVHQPTCYGFEEFQKITLNGLREYSESKNYFKRFAQMTGNQLKHIKFLEGRFSPKDSKVKNDRLLGEILNGWDELQKEQKRKNVPESSLKLVAHFIKREEKHKPNLIRYQHLREDVKHRADLLKQLLRDHTRLSNVVLGIDAAASEFDTPPEVYAQVYRNLRASGYRHFTYHAGEDFFHVLSGLRAIYEAITFLDLRRCDRIGHASVTGIPVALWKENIGDKLLIKRGEHLDNLIFAYHLISLKGDMNLKSFLPMISLRIEELSYDIYNKSVPITLHIKAWKSRDKDPREIINSNEDLPEKELIRMYHQYDVSKRYDEIIEIDTYDILGEKELTQLQLMLLEEMHQREIVIETLPTSNVFIGNHHDYSTYHIYNWYKWKKEGKPLPPIVVGTDDVGIFATNIYNEYCNIFCQFVYDKKINTDEATAFIKELEMNSSLYAFNKIHPD